MNKFQEALHYFIRWLNPIEEDFNQEIYRKHRNNLQKLIDKETPIEPELIAKCEEHEIYNCKKCKQSVRKNENYCKYCGQRLR